MPVIGAMPRAPSYVLVLGVVVACLSGAHAEGRTEVTRRLEDSTTLADAQATAVTTTTANTTAMEASAVAEEST
eukprot:CAMPEP_0195123320 /NCGR_PEP_ID=MMETSP0448-20130528/128460_1 /TAXON_ID=66468 /ORGANISM="Heterocapsa triquestra, Strain CCMP 448" /LENGTH=73 /DNA_ID=CAMNT_0040160869 /DNA_START=3 /DNA_END=220 /DNA_ORIENTATION=+